jgi:hypothetical protein
MAWRPTTIRRFIRGFPSSARTALVETDAGQGYLKAMGGPDGPHTLAAELIGTQLAHWFELPTLDWAIIDVDEIDEIPFVDKDGNRTGSAASGPAFITRAEEGNTWSGGDRELNRLANPQDLGRLVVFDTWVLNCDRHCPPKEDSFDQPRINRNNVFLSAEGAPEGQFILKAIDHTHCFTCGREWTKRLSQIDRIKEPRVFGLFPAFRTFLDRRAIIEVAANLRTVKKAEVNQMIRRIPDQWKVGEELRQAIVDLVVQRAEFVAQTIDTRIWPQLELRLDGEDQSEATP